MGCHTICYRPADPSICKQVWNEYEAAKAYVFKQLLAEKYDLIDQIDRTITRKKKRSMPGAWRQVEVVDRKIDMVSNNFCQSAVVSRYLEMKKIDHEIYRGKLYVPEYSYDDIFRTSYRPPMNKEDVIEFVSTSSEVSLYDSLEDTIKNLEAFWAKHPEGIIFFQ